MDQFLTSNSHKDRDLFLTFLLETVCKNILDHPSEVKYQRLKRSSKAFGVVKSVKMGANLLDYLGFRPKVEEFQEFLVLRTEGEWLDEFREKTELIEREWRKKQNSDKIDSRSKATVEAENAKYKEALLTRIHEDRKERGEKK